MFRKFHLIIFPFLLTALFSCSDSFVKKAKPVDKSPVIFPDYTNLVIPVNIAPLNFIIKEEGTTFKIKFAGQADNYGFIVSSRSPEIRIPIKKWKKLLKRNSNKDIYITVYDRSKDGEWSAYKRITDFVTTDKIDPYIVYRRINTALKYWNDMSIMQRNVENYDESTIISNKNTDNNCIHCHTFQNRNPEQMLLHLRKAPGGTLIKTKDKTLWLNAKTNYTLSAFVYPDWDPKADLIAFSTNKIYQNFYGSGNRHNFVRDKASDIVIYDLNTNKIFTSPEIASKDLENMPAWAPDGKYLYYISCDYKYKDVPNDSVKYDLKRISFDEKTHKFGKAEMVLSSKETGMSMTFPEVSPDGRYLMFCGATAGYFTIGNPTTDLYLLDLKTGNYTKPDINSDQTESWHFWSSNSRWVVFASKRYDGLISLPWFSYIDSMGSAHKPFVLPFEDPKGFTTRLLNFNRPVFVTGRVPYTQDELVKDVYGKTTDVIFDTVNVDVSALNVVKESKKVQDADVDNAYKKN